MTLSAEHPSDTAPSSAPAPVLDGLDALTAAVDGQVLLPGDDGYAEECSPYNLAVSHAPAVVVGAAGPADVQAAVRFAVRNDLPVAVMATGHQASLPADGAVLITTRRMDRVSIDPARRTARVGAGVRWRAVVDAAAEHGLAPLNGSSPLVGVVGYTLGGGLSPTMGRLHGWASDHVTAVEVVTADGELHQLENRGEDSPEADLLWGLLASKSNVGVVTALEFGLFPVTHLHAGGLFFAGEHAAAVLAAYAELTAGAPDELTTSIGLTRFPPLPFLPDFLSGRFAVHVRFSLVGDAATADALLAPLRACAPVVLDTVGEMPYRENASIHDDPVDPAPFTQRTVLLKEFTPESLADLVDLFGPGSDCPVHIVELRQLGGALAAEGDQPYAAAQREAAFALCLFVIGPPRGSAAASAWIDEAFRRLGPHTAPGAYANFTAAWDTDPEDVRRAYLPATFERVQRVKARHDPRNLFRLNLNVLPRS
ncbi:FAD-binding oxidoreductase [Kineococcus sp. SYSU DK005]|uniref:FAD-binding oxidoreductase n=1 Tax=Kineococcus sp. SYSU DK005 TaxID=3383126 RepID=UPI003D7ED1CC